MIIGLVVVLVVAAVIGGVAWADHALHWLVWLSIGIFVGGVLYGLAVTYVPALFGWGEKVGKSHQTMPTQPPSEPPPDQPA